MSLRIKILIPFKISTTIILELSFAPLSVENIWDNTLENIKQTKIVILLLKYQGHWIKHAICLLRKLQVVFYRNNKRDTKCKKFYSYKLPSNTMYFLTCQGNSANLARLPPMIRLLNALCLVMPHSGSFITGGSLENFLSSLPDRHRFPTRIELSTLRPVSVKVSWN